MNQALCNGELRQTAVAAGRTQREIEDEQKETMYKVTKAKKPVAKARVLEEVMMETHLSWEQVAAQTKKQVLPYSNLFLAPEYIVYRLGQILLAGPREKVEEDNRIQNRTSGTSSEGQCFECHTELAGHGTETPP